MNYIKELYYGNISPSAQKFVKGSEYAKQHKSNDRLRDQLKASVTSEDIKIVDVICENYSNLISMKFRGKLCLRIQGRCKADA